MEEFNDVREPCEYLVCNGDSGNQMLEIKFARVLADIFDCFKQRYGYRNTMTLNAQMEVLYSIALAEAVERNVDD